MQITVSQLTYSYDDAPDQALTPVSTTFPEGWTGIVGSNGCGKSTLLRLICGELVPTAGQITPQVKGVYCAQETESEPVEAQDFVLDYSSEALRIKRILEIDDDWVWRYDSLSQGERKRLQVAVALWANPLVLALDEPTNHVDALCRERLIEALKAYRGVGLLVSHDREMLDQLTSQCLFLGSNKAVMRPGNYSEGKEQEQAEHSSAVHERKAAKAELSRLQQVKANRDNEAARADARRSKKHIAQGDKDAKGRIDLAIYTGQDGKAGKRSVQMDARLSSAEQRLENARVDKVYNADVWLDAEPSHRRVLLELDEGCLAFGTGERIATKKGGSLKESMQRALAATCYARSAEWKNDPELKAEEQLKSAALDTAADAAKGAGAGLCIPHLAVGPKDHIALLGPNGAGKSTLIAALVHKLSSDLRMLYIPQELRFEERRQQLAALKELPQSERGRALSIVAQLNSDPDRLLSGNLASPGETRKLMLALGILAHPQIIIMDEPTNHLDLISTEALENLLAGCPCALILVSHDQSFLDATTSIRWIITPGEEGSHLTIA